MNKSGDPIPLCKEETTSINASGSYLKKYHNEGIGLKGGRLTENLLPQHWDTVTRESEEISTAFAVMHFAWLNQGIHFLGLLVLNC